MGVLAPAVTLYGLAIAIIITVAWLTKSVRAIFATLAFMALAAGIGVFWLSQAT